MSSPQPTTHSQSNTLGDDYRLTKLISSACPFTLCGTQKNIWTIYESSTGAYLRHYYNDKLLTLRYGEVTHVNAYTLLVSYIYGYILHEVGWRPVLAHPCRPGSVKTSEQQNVKRAYPTLTSIEIWATVLPYRLSSLIPLRSIGAWWWKSAYQRMGGP